MEEVVGVRLELLVTGWLALVALVVAVVLWVIHRRSSYYSDGLIISTTMFSLVAGVAGLVWVLMLWPYSTEYHKLYKVEGTVETVTNKMVEASGEFSEHTVLTLDTVDRPVLMSDPRGVTLEGRDVELTCRMQWHYKAQDTYHCAIYSIGDTR